jgi:predicted aspartyl protease
VIAAYYGSVVAFHKGVPKAEVYVINPATGKKTRYAAIVDTGADHLLLDAAAAANAGLTYSALPGITVTTAGGSAVLKQAKIVIELEGVRLTVPAWFGPTPAGVLLGRSALLKALEIAFDVSDWGYNIPPSSGTSAVPAGSSVGAQPGVQPPPTAAQGPPPRPPRIIDHGSWIDIGGVRVEKRELPSAARAHLSLREQIEKAVEHLRKVDVKSGGLADNDVLDRVLTVLSERHGEDTDIEIEKITREVMNAAQRDKRTISHLANKYHPQS